MTYGARSARHPLRGMTADHLAPVPGVRLAAFGVIEQRQSNIQPPDGRSWEASTDDPRSKPGPQLHISRFTLNSRLVETIDRVKRCHPAYQAEDLRCALRSQIPIGTG